MNLDTDLRFAPQHTQEELDGAINWLQREGNRRQFRYATNFALFGTANKTLTLFSYFGQPCHREIQGTHANLRSLVATECGWPRRGDVIGRGPRELFEPFFKWLTEESLYSRFILWANLDYGFVVSADVYTPLMQNLMITTRHFYEVHKNGFVNFNKLLENGIPGDIAYPLAFNSTLSQPSPGNSKFTSVYSHRVTPLFDLQEFVMWVKKETGGIIEDDLNDPEQYYRKRKTYTGGKDLFRTRKIVLSDLYFDAGLIRNLMDIKEFRDALSEYRKAQGEVGVYKPPNPFAPKVLGLVLPAANEVSNDEAIAVVAPFLTQYLEPFRTRT